jgi:hypothetical protein
MRTYMLLIYFLDRLLKPTGNIWPVTTIKLKDKEIFAVRHVVIFAFCKNTSTNFFIITNLIHKFLVHSHKLYKIKFLYMFRAQSAHHQEVNDATCTYVASGIVTLCKRRSLAESDDTRGCICTICVVDLLMTSGLRSKHVEEFNFI